MRILGIETSGSTFSIALLENNSIVSEIFLNSGLKHSEKLVPSLKWLLKESEWDIKSVNKIAVTIGPGSFTGIRVGLTCARTIAQTLKIPLVGINTLDVLEESVPKGDYIVLPFIDALRREVYVKGKGNNNIEIKPMISLLRDLSKIKNKILLIGNAALTYNKEIKKILKNKMIPVLEHLHFPRAGILVSIAKDSKGQKYNKIKPLYIRRSWAEEKK